MNRKYNTFATKYVTHLGNIKETLKRDNEIERNPQNCMGILQTKQEHHFELNNYSCLQYFPLYPQHFERLPLNPFPNKPCFSCVCSTFENTEEKGEIVRNDQFLLYPLCFLPV